MALRVLLDHGVLPQHIVFVTLLASVKGGVHALQRAFPKVRIVTAAVGADLVKRRVYQPQPVVAPTAAPAKEGERASRPTALNLGQTQNRSPSIDQEPRPSRICWSIEPGAGNLGDR